MVAGHDVRPVRHGGQRAHDRVHDPVGALVAARAGRREDGVDQRSRWRLDRDRPIAAVVARDRGIRAGLDREVDGRGHHAEGAIDRTAGLRVGAPKVDHQLVTANPDRDPDKDRLIDDAVVLHVVLADIVAIGPRGDHLSHAPLRLPADRLDRHLDRLATVARHELAQARNRRAVGRGLRLEVTPHVAGHPHVVEDQLAEIAVEDARSVELDRRDAESLLVDLTGLGIEAAGGGPPRRRDERGWRRTRKGRPRRTPG